VVKGECEANIYIYISVSKTPGRIFSQWLHDGMVPRLEKSRMKIQRNDRTTHLELRTDHPASTNLTTFVQQIETKDVAAYNNHTTSFYIIICKNLVIIQLHHSDTLSFRTRNKTTPKLFRWTTARIHQLSPQCKKERERHLTNASRNAGIFIFPPHPPPVGNSSKD